MKRKKINKAAYRVILAVSTVLLVITVGSLLKEEYTEYGYRKEFAAIEKKQESLNREDVYDKFHKRNSDFVGYLNIKGTGISYPVMQTKADPDYYLTHDFNKKYSFYGIPYLDSRCETDSMNLIIYSHNINGGRMFGELLKYTSYEFFQNHEYICFTTKTGESLYRICAVIKTTDVSPWYGFVNSESDEEYKRETEYLEKNSIYDCKTTVDEKNGYITLSTCGNDGTSRFMVIGIKQS